MRDAYRSLVEPTKQRTARAGSERKEQKPPRDCNAAGKNIRVFYSFPSSAFSPQIKWRSYCVDEMAMMVFLFTTFFVTEIACTVFSVHPRLCLVLATAPRRSNVHCPHSRGRKNISSSLSLKICLLFFLSFFNPARILFWKARRLAEGSLAKMLP